MSLKFLQCVHYYPNYGTCELVDTVTGQRYQNVTVLTEFISNNSGSRIHHGVLRPPSEEEAGGYMPSDEDRTVIAACVMVAGRPMVVGFIAHAMTQLAFVLEEQNRDIYRHPAGTLATVAKNGDFELQHTGACFFRIGNGVGGVDPVQHQDLTPLCANENWLLPFNEQPTVTLCNNLFRLVVEPTGDTEMLSGGNLTITYRGNALINVGGDAEVNVLGSLEANVDGDLRARARGAAYVSSQGDAQVGALGGATLASAGPCLVGSLEVLTLEAPVININAGALNVAAGEFGVAAGAFTAAAGTIGFSAGELAALAGQMTLGAAEVFMPTEMLNVTGGITEGGGSGAGIAAGAAGSAAGGAGAATGGAAGVGSIAAAVALASEELADAAAELAQAGADIEAAVQTCIDTSEPARGIGPPDNEGLGGDPAPDVP